MIDTDSLRRTPDQQDLVHDPRDPRGRQRDVDFDLKRFPVVVVDDVEGPEAAAVHQGIAHEVRGPGLVGTDRLDQRLRGLGFVAALESPADIELHLAVHAPDSLVVPWISGLSDQNEQLPEAEPGVTFSQLGQNLDDRAVIGTLAFVSFRRAAQSDHSAGSSFTDGMRRDRVLGQIASRAGRQSFFSTISFRTL